MQKLYKLTRADFDACAKYAANNPSDPFAFIRAVSRLRNFGKSGINVDDSGHLTLD